jgi:hypothetical protein
MQFKFLLTTMAIATTAALSGCGPTDYSSVTVLAEPTPVVGHSYAWQPVPPSSASVGADNPILRQRIENAVNSAMAAKGYTLVNATVSPDLLIAYRVGAKQKSDVSVTSSGGYYGGWGWGYYGAPMTSVQQVHYTEGGMMIDVMDAKKGTLEWRSLYKDRVTADTITQESLNRIAVQALASLPTAGGVPAVPVKK